ncbi:MAG: DUF2298 domain-containing protein, partial [Clostridiales bacterium]|nr:DUF2298 domain-containing protein [Clostridiales bacterium]
YVIARYRDLRWEGYITIKGQEYYKKKASKPKKKKIVSQENDSTKIAFSGEKNKLFQFIEHLPIADLFIVTIGLCAIGLIIMPEVIYVEDIYPSYSRANTMFKLTYQGYIMFGLCMAYIFIRGVRYARFELRKIAAGLGLLLLIWTAFYSVTSVRMWQGGGKPLKMEKYKNLDSIEFMKNRCQDDYDAILWLNENVTGTKVITEAYGASYSEFNRISAFTGLPTLIGWQTHEHLWRSGALDGFPPEVTERNNDITKIYTSTDTNEILYYLKKYDVDYIYIGCKEQESFTSETNEILKSLGEVVFDSPANEIKGYETAIVQVNKELFDTVVDVVEE